MFWADIPEQVVKANDKLEETKAWGRTVVSRAESAYRSNVPDGQLRPQDFELGVGVVEEVIETIGVLENLLAVAAKAGVFKFELAPLLRDYVGDVQLVTDFPFYREKIVYRFHNALAQIYKGFEQLYPDHTPEIYIVAHGEGTVISFLGLLQALSGEVVTDPDNTLPVPIALDDRWIGCVRGYMTIGSPIDKHIVLWPPPAWRRAPGPGRHQRRAGTRLEHGRARRRSAMSPSATCCVCSPTMPGPRRCTVCRRSGSSGRAGRSSVAPASRTRPRSRASGRACNCVAPGAANAADRRATRCARLQARPRAAQTEPAGNTVWPARLASTLAPAPRSA